MLINKHQPVRPRISPSGEVLRYKTMPTLSQRAYLVTDQRNMVAQLRLYRAVRRGLIPNHVSIDELHNYLFYDYPLITKKVMGATVIRTTMYDPRRLKGVTKNNPKACMLYSFHDMLEFEYGLEWMICTWLRNFLNAESAPKDHIAGPERMEEELDILVNTDDEDVIDVYETPLWAFTMEEPPWISLTSGKREQVPAPSEAAPAPRLSSLRSYQ